METAAVVVLATGCGVERVAAVEGAAGGMESSAPRSDDAASLAATDAELSESAGNDALAGSTCTVESAVCQANNSGCYVGMYYLYDNQFNCGGSTGNTCGPESAFACMNPDGTVAFVVDSNQAAGNTLALTYSAIQRNFNNPPLGSFQAITATFDETTPKVGSYDDTFEVWLDQQTILVMVWVDRFARTPAGALAMQVTIGGRTYEVWTKKSASQIQIAFVSTETFTSGTVDLLPILQSAIAQGFVPASPTLGQIEFGVEIASTGGESATFQFNAISIETQ